MFQLSQGRLSNAASSEGVDTRSLGAIVGHDRIMMDRQGMNDAPLCALAAIQHQLRGLPSDDVDETQLVTEDAMPRDKVRREHSH